VPVISLPEWGSFVLLFIITESDEKRAAITCGFKKDFYLEFRDFF